MIDKVQESRPNLRIGQSVKMINCPDAVITPDRIWTIRSEPYFFEEEWRVLLNEWIGSFPVKNVKAVDFNEAGGMSS